MRIIAISLILSLVISAACTCRGVPNHYPIIEANFTKVASHEFGEKYHYFSPEANQNYYLLRVWGNSYQAGVAYGTLMKEEIVTNVRNIWAYIANDI